MKFNNNQAYYISTYTIYSKKTKYYRLSVNFRPFVIRNSYFFTWLFVSF
jgi:hypothetical protein